MDRFSRSCCQAQPPSWSRHRVKMFWMGSRLRWDFFASGKNYLAVAGCFWGQVERLTERTVRRTTFFGKSKNLKLEVVVGVDDGSPPVALTQSSFCKLATGFGATLHCQARSEKQRLLYDWTFTMGYYRHRLWHCTMLSSLSRPCLASPSCYSSSPPHKCFFKKRAISTNT